MGSTWFNMGVTTRGHGFFSIVLDGRKRWSDHRLGFAIRAMRWPIDSRVFSPMFQIWIRKTPRLVALWYPQDGPVWIGIFMFRMNLGIIKFLHIQNTPNIGLNGETTIYYIYIYPLVMTNSLPWYFDGPNRNRWWLPFLIAWWIFLVRYMC